MIPSLRFNFCRAAHFSACTLASALALSVGFAAPSAESRPQPTPEIRLSLADARADFDQLAAIVTDKHPKLFAHQAELTATIAYERRRFQSFVKDFFAEAHARGVARLILDLRDNNGGDHSCAATLFAHLIERPAPYFAPDSPYYPDLRQPQNPAPDRFSGRLFVMINGGGFSSTGYLCALLKYHRRGIFIGEETGGSYACTDASETTTLEHSKIRFRHSTLVFKAAVSGMTPGRGTLPDHTVVASIDDAVQERDPSMARAIELVQTPAAALPAIASTTADLVSHP